MNVCQGEVEWKKSEKLKAGECGKSEIVWEDRKLGLAGGLGLGREPVSDGRMIVKRPQAEYQHGVLLDKSRQEISSK